jgi:hypothetical protein
MGSGADEGSHKSAGERQPFRTSQNWVLLSSSGRPPKTRRSARSISMPILRMSIFLRAKWRGPRRAVLRLSRVSPQQYRGYQPKGCLERAVALERDGPYQGGPALVPHFPLAEAWKFLGICGGSRPRAPPPEVTYG